MVEKESDGRSRSRHWVLFLALTVVSVLFRIPPLLNARGVHSDAAIVGLQALHILKGEWSWFLWGAPYQASIDALLLAIGFLLGGATPLTLMLVPLTGHLILTWLAFDVLSRRLDRWSAVLAVLPLVFAPHAINSVALYAPRQWSITLLFGAVWLIDGAQESQRSLIRYGLATALGTIAVYLDLYVLQLIPAFIGLAVLCCWDNGDRLTEKLRRLGACASGFLIGLVFLWVVHRLRGGVPAQAGLSFSNIARNWGLFWNECLPWALSYKAFFPVTANVIWHPPIVIELVQIGGAILLLVGILSGGLALVIRRVPWKVRRLGAFGLMVAVSSLAGFLLSGMPYDKWAVRYLAPLIWFSPFALAPAAHLLRAARFGLALAPYLFSASIAGWLAYGSYVHGPLPRLDARGLAHDEAQLGAALRQRGIHHAAAQYWLSYRLTFLFGEDPIVFPLDGDDRYPPYRAAFQAAPVVAYLFHPSEPRATAGPFENQFRTMGANYERLEVAGFTVLVLHRVR